MLCPGCNGELKPVSVLALDNSFRCEKCKGFWVANWVVNNLASGKQPALTVVGVETKVGDGQNKCPTDGTNLISPPRDAVPEGLAAEKCLTCAWWWFPGDELFKFQQAFAAKSEYLRKWKKNDWTAYAWPALVLAILVGGLTGSVVLIKSRQEAVINAALGVREFVATPLGQGTVEIRFTSETHIQQAEYRNALSRDWTLADVSPEGNMYLIRLRNLEKGTYFVRIQSKEFEFEVK